SDAISAISRSSPLVTNCPCTNRSAPFDGANWSQFFEAKHPAPPQVLVQNLLDAGCRDGLVDQRLCTYLEILLSSQTIDVSVLLSAVLPVQPGDGTALEASLLDGEDSAKPSVQAFVLPLLSRVIANGSISEESELFVFLKHLLPWINRFPSSIVIGFLVSATLGCSIAQEVLPGTKGKKLKTVFGQALIPMVANLSQTNIQLASALSYWQKHYQMQDALPQDSMELLGGVDLGALSFQESVLDNEPMNTRAGLYVYLNAMGNVPTLVTDLILAAFDIFANAIYRTESSQSITVLRCFLVNKLPAFLNNYAAIIFPPLSIEMCISQALLRVDPAAFPSFSQMFDLLGKNGMLSEARQEFLFACALQQLIPEGSIEALLGDVPMQSLPASGRYVKDDLVANCTANPARIEELVGELENMEGNAGEIAGALIELLDHWQEHEDQVENQPVYDEFGSVLLLISAIKHRFALDLADIGISAPESFVSQYFKSACESRAVNKLTEHENELLGGWVRGLFETEGINDELMSICKPAEFHLLVSTLFDQSIKACQAGVLGLDTLTGGLEYLLEPFLLPSLAAGLTWFANKLWETKESFPLINILMPALSILIKPPSMSADRAAIHSAVLSVVAEPLDQALTHAQRVYKLRVDISPLTETLKSHVQKHGRDADAYTELAAWAVTPSMGLQVALKNLIRLLSQWCLAEQSGAAASPPSYTYRLLRSCVQLVGAKATLETLVDEVLREYNNEHVPHAEIVLDVVVTMIVAPQPDLTSQRLTLGEVLATEFQTTNELSKTDPDRARVIVRLHRRVQSFIAANSNDVGVGMGEGRGMVLSNAEGLPTTDIDDVLAHTEERINSGEFLGGTIDGRLMSIG
ncbi:MAG: hypothetical protein LQ341_004573, partial [Variospora aurantia]